MGYWPKSVKRRRHNWITELGRKLVLIGCEGSQHVVWPNHPTRRLKRYYLCHPVLRGVPEGAFIEPGQQVTGFSEDSVTVKGARMMEIID